MKHQLTFILATILFIAAINAQADPEEDRLALLDHYRQTFPDIKYEDYVYGALAMNPEAKAQYDEMMEFPPFAAEVRQGGVIWETPFKNGQKFESCFKNSGTFAAANYPYYDDHARRVVTFENAVNDCLKSNNEPEVAYGSKEMAILTSYARSLSNHAKVKVKVKSAGALAAYENGKQTYYKRIGQLNFACATCHVDYAGRFVRSEQLSMMIGQASHWPEFRAGTEPTTLQGRFAQCQKNIRAKPFEFNSTEYNNLEFFMTYMSNGLKMLTPVFRK
jgi:sulfur-oxidizing protein SoxA